MAVDPAILLQGIALGIARRKQREQAVDYESQKQAQEYAREMAKLQYQTRGRLAEQTLANEGALAQKVAGNEQDDYDALIRGMGVAQREGVDVGELARFLIDVKTKGIANINPSDYKMQGNRWDQPMRIAQLRETGLNRRADQQIPIKLFGQSVAASTGTGEHLDSIYNRYATRVGEQSGVPVAPIPDQMGPPALNPKTAADVASKAAQIELRLGDREERRRAAMDRTKTARDLADAVNRYRYATLAQKKHEFTQMMKLRWDQMDYKEQHDAAVLAKEYFGIESQNFREQMKQGAQTQREEMKIQAKAAEKPPPMTPFLRSLWKQHDQLASMVNRAIAEGEDPESIKAMQETLHTIRRRINEFTRQQQGYPASPSPNVPMGALQQQAFPQGADPSIPPGYAGGALPPMRIIPSATPRSRLPELQMMPSHRSTLRSDYTPAQRARIERNTSTPIQPPRKKKKRGSLRDDLRGF